jgi:hypothetical protein
MASSAMNSLGHKIQNKMGIDSEPRQNTVAEVSGNRPKQSSQFECTVRGVFFVFFA